MTGSAGAGTDAAEAHGPKQNTSRPRDPGAAILEDPRVPEHQRFCRNESCREPVGRSRDGLAGRTEGFCVACGTAFAFSPKLTPGELVNDQYEVRGCINFGGLGWIYLAKDQRVGFYVVLKGLINNSDGDGNTSMEEELNVLAQVDHPSIVTVHNFVEHPDRHSDATIGYIVEEYIAGRSLREFRLARPSPGGGAGRVEASETLPLRQVIAYMLEILPALGYLHSRGLIYCDFKPDNIIQTDGRLKLVDLGAVRRVDDDHSSIYGTPGYQAPEVAKGMRPSVSSDVYTVGRTMAVLSVDFPAFDDTYADALPEPERVPLFPDHESYYRLLCRATDSARQRRFASVEEMAEQLRGVFREVLAAEEGQARPGLSSVFEPETRTFGAEIGAALVEPMTATAGAAAALPMPQVDPTDPAAGLLASVTTPDLRQLVERLRAGPEQTVELRLRLARTFVELDDLSAATRELDDLDAMAPEDWRVEWYRGLVALAAGRPAEAWAAFNATYAWLPGEAVPKLARAVAAERAGDPTASAGDYERVWRTDHSYVSAAFGMARTQLALGERGRAVAALDEVPEASTHYIAAQVAAVRAHLEPPADLLLADLEKANERIDRINLDAPQRERLYITLFGAALDWIDSSDPGRRSSSLPRDARVRGYRLRERDLRLGMEGCYRALARLAESREQRYTLVDQANATRPTTWV